jgi:hypothetical protein
MTWLTARVKQLREAIESEFDYREAECGGSVIAPEQLDTVIERHLREAIEAAAQIADRANVGSDIYRTRIGEAIRRELLGEWSKDANT